MGLLFYKSGAKSMKQEQMSLCITLKKSKNLIVFVVIMHVLALISSFMASILSVIKLTLILAISLHLIYSLFSIAKLCGLVIRFSHAKHWEFGEGDTLSQIQILPGTVLTPLIIFLLFKKQSGKKQSMLIASDAVSVFDFRRLSLELRIAKLAK